MEAEQRPMSGAGTIGVAELEIQMDGPVAYPIGEREAYIRHTEEGCYVYGGSGRDAVGRTVYYIGGPGSIIGPTS